MAALGARGGSSFGGWLGEMVVGVSKKGYFLPLPSSGLLLAQALYHCLGIASLGLVFLHSVCVCKSAFLDLLKAAVDANSQGFSNCFT